jgi:predicted phosphodiesterase
MSFQVVSDIHLERRQYNGLGDFVIPSATNLILAGDIGNPLMNNSNLYRFLSDACEAFVHVFYVFGNHEYYNTQGYSIRYMSDRIRDCVRRYPNVHILDNESFVLGDVRVIGTTLWSHCPSKEVADYVKTHMNDYRYIYAKANQLVDVQMMNIIFREAIIFLQHELLIAKKKNQKPLVITHHLPSFVCVEQRFKTSPLNCAYASNLDNIICEANMQFWIHGHTHAAVDILLDGTRIVSNPIGYEQENAYTNKTCTFVIH